MKIAHLILTHKNPLQVERLITAMDHPSFAFFIHIDKKTNAAPFLYLTEKKNVFLIKKRTKIYWASYGTIQATLNGFLEILPQGYDYINVISGQDFPLKTPDMIYRHFCELPAKEYIKCWSMKDKWSDATKRITKYHLINWHFPGKYILERWANRVLPARKFPLDYEVVGGSNWFALTRQAAQYILEFLPANPRFVRFLKYTWGADEILFATTLYNSPFKENIRHYLMYVDWSEAKDGHPKILRSEDYDILTTTPKLFARKFDLNVDENIITRLESWLESKK